MDATTETPAAPASEAAEPSVADAIRAAVEEAAAEPEEGAEPAAPAPEPKPDDKPAEKPPEPKPDNDRVTAALRGAARREKAALDATRAAKAVEGQAKAFQEFTRLLDEDPVAALKALGKDPRGVFQRVIDKGEPQAPTPESQIADLQRWRDQREARETADAQARNIADQKAGVAKIIADAGEQFELINAQGEHDLVWDAMVAYYTEHGTAADPVEVAKGVEEFLIAKAEKALATKRFATRVNAQPSNGKPQQPIPGETTIAGSRATPVPSADDDFPLDDHERMKAVMRSLG